jgi:3-oxoacyl-[acyl-carrier protein] reductase
MDVVLTGRREDALDLAAKEIGATAGAGAGAGAGAADGGEVRYLRGDLADPASSAGLVGEVERRWGTPVDVLVVNAGGPPPGRILAATDDDWYRGVELLLLGPLRVARAALPGMAARGFGRVVVVTSVAVRKPEPDLALSVVLRSAVTAAATLMSREHAAHGVTVNCVAPGATATARREQILANRAAATGVSRADLEASEVAAVPAGRAGRPEEIAAAIAFLASDDAAYVNGTVLTVDGGRTETIW